VEIDTLGCSVVDVMRTIDKLHADGIKLRSLTEELDSESAQDRTFLQMHGSMAEHFST
jgi:DNA invertase Pin-like site-specific DNA recombinase